jgi:hypothetical protein
MYSRLYAFTPMELQALDEFFRSFADLRQSTADIGKLQSEIADAMRRREIPAFGPPAAAAPSRASVDPLSPKVKRGERG